MHVNNFFNKARPRPWPFILWFTTFPIELFKNFDLTFLFIPIPLSLKSIIVFDFSFLTTISMIGFTEYLSEFSRILTKTFITVPN